MDFVSPVFPYDQFDEQLEFSSFPCQQDTLIQEDTLRVTPSPYIANATSKPDESLRQKSSVALEDAGDNDYKRKKIIHRDIERQRRKEMAALFGSLRSLLPLEYLKRKRSVSDHMHEAVNYINHLHKRIEVMKKTREELKRSLDQSTINSGSKCLRSCVQASVTVEASIAGFRVTVSTAMSEGVSTSRVLKVLLQEGLAVLSCASTNIEERLLLSIESEVAEGRSINPSELQMKLADLTV